MAHFIIMLNVDDANFEASPMNEVARLIDTVTSDPLVMSSVQWAVREGNRAGRLLNIDNKVVGAWAIKNED